MLSIQISISYQRSSLFWQADQVGFLMNVCRRFEPNSRFVDRTQIEEKFVHFLLSVCSFLGCSSRCIGVDFGRNWANAAELERMDLIDNHRLVAHSGGSCQFRV